MKKLIYIVFILILTSCKNDEPDNQITYSHLNPTLKSDYSFHEGSYWVYQDQAMNEDSIVLINFETAFTSTCPHKSCPRQEFIKLHFENITRGLTYNHYLLSDFIRFNGGGDWGQEGQPIFILDRDEAYEFNGLVVGESLDSMIVLNETFYNVKKMSVIADNQFQNEFDNDMEFYFVPSIGIVRFIEYDTPSGNKI